MAVSINSLSCNGYLTVKGNITGLGAAGTNITNVSAGTNSINGSTDTNWHTGVFRK